MTQDDMVMIDPDYRESDEDRTARLIGSLATMVTDAKGIVIARDDAVFLAERWLDMQARLAVQHKVFYDFAKDLDDAGFHITAKDVFRLLLVEHVDMEAADA
jgi:hypothetical protein